MGTDARDAEVDVIARDKTSKPVRGITREYERLQRQVDRVVKANTSADKSFGRVVKRVTAFTRSVAAAGARVAALASTVGPLVVGLVAAGKAAVAFGKGLARLGPLAGFLPSLAGALALVVGTLKLAGPGLGRALDPIRRQFVDAEGNASRFTRRLQDLVSRGVEPLARQFVKVNFPTIARGMEQISRAANRVVVNVGKWVNSAEGQRLIEIITTRTANAMDRLGPKVEKAVIALGRLALRAGDKAINGLADLIGRILDRFTAWANSTSVDDINRALKDLSGYATLIRDRFNALREVGRWLAENEGKVRKFASAVAVLGLTLGLLSGNYVTAALAGLSLLLTNFDTLKAKLSSPELTGFVQRFLAAFQRLAAAPEVRAFVAAIQAHFMRLAPLIQGIFAQIQQQVMPQLRALGQVVMRDLLPAVTGFINAASPIVVWFVSKFAPVVVTAVTSVVAVVRGAMLILAGIINAVTAAITLDWRKLWEGVKQIVAGAAAVSAAITRALWATIKAVFSAGVEAALARAGQFKSRLVGMFKGAASWLVGIGRSIVEGLVRGIREGAGLIPGAINGLIDKAKSMIPGPLRGALGWSASDNGWRPAQFAAAFAGGGNFAMGGGGGRTGGPTPVTVDNRIEVSVAGEMAGLFAVTARAIAADRQRERWRNQVGRR